MKVLTTWQPWASLIAIGAKPYEFRGWKPPGRMVGTRIAIHAGARKIVHKEVKALLARLHSARAWEVCLHAELAEEVLRLALHEPDRLPLSAILCTAVLGPPRNGYDVAAEFGMPAEERAAITGGLESDGASAREGAHAAPNDSDRDEHANFAWPLGDIDLVIPPEPFRGKQGFGEWGGR